MRSSGKLFSAVIFGSARSTSSLKDGWFACSFCPLWFVRRLRRQFVVRLSTVQWECDIGWCGGRYLRRAWMPLIKRTATSSETQLLCSPHRMQECGSETGWSTHRTLGHQPGCHSPDEDPKVCEKIAPMACRLMRRRLGGSSGVNHNLMISMVDDATDPYAQAHRAR